MENTMTVQEIAQVVVRGSEGAYGADLLAELGDIGNEVPLESTQFDTSIRIDEIRFAVTSELREKIPNNSVLNHLINDPSAMNLDDVGPLIRKIRFLHRVAQHVLHL